MKRFRITGKRAVGIVGCGIFCLLICVMAFWNRTLVLEPVTAFLRGDTDFEEMRITVQENYLSGRVRGRLELISLNGGYAGLQGRTRYNKVQKMTNGMLGTPATEVRDITDFTENMSRFSQSLEERGIPFLFVLTPYKEPLRETLLPTGITDTTNTVADQAVARLETLGVPVLDLRREMSATGEQVEQYFYRTDHHWNAEGSFYAYKRIMEAVQSRFPDTKMTYADSSLWEKTVLPRWWLGSQGRRVGPLYAGVDDLDYYLPTFETEMSRYSPGICACYGDFREACMEDWLLEHSDYFNADSYSRYLGGGHPLAYHRNVRAENQKSIFIIRDSFMLPVECFLSTEFTALDVLDPRGYGAMDESTYVTLNQPDMVIVMICPMILTNQFYPYYTNFGTVQESKIISEAAWEELTVAAAAGEPEYAALPIRTRSGCCGVLTMEHIQVGAGTPVGAAVALYDGETLLDQTIFDIDYGNAFGFRWGFRIPASQEEEHDYQLRFYAGISGGQEGTELIYQGIRLQEWALTEKD